MDYSQWPRLIVAGSILVAGFYLLIPWLIYFTQRMNGDPRIVIFDESKNRPPKRVAEYLEDAGETLLGLGFEPSPCVALPDPMPNVRAIAQLWIHPERRDAALVSAIFGVSKETAGNLQTYYTEILSRFASEDVTLIQTNNAQMISAFAPLPNELTFRFPQVKSVSQLDRLHRKLTERHAPGGRKVVSLDDQHHGDLQEYIRWALVDSYRKQEGTGYLVFQEAGNYWRPTVKGAYLMTWSQLWPMSLLFQWKMQRQAQRLMRDLSADEDARPNFKITTKRDTDQLEVRVEKDKTTISVRSPAGISHAVIERTAVDWTEAVSLRLHLKGLENFRVSNGKVTLAAAVSSHEESPKVRLWLDGDEEAPLDSRSPYWMKIRLVGADGKPARSIPLKDGYFEMTLPRAFLTDQPQSLTLNWIDFYRN